MLEQVNHHQVTRDLDTFLSFIGNTIYIYMYSIPSPATLPLGMSLPHGQRQQPVGSNEEGTCHRIFSATNGGLSTRDVVIYP